MREPETLVAIAVVAAVGVVAVCCSGCGGALRAQAGAATVLGVALEGAHRAAIAGVSSELDACQDAACTVAVEQRYSPAATAHDVARAALALWIDALEIAREAEASGDVLAALATAASRALAAWTALASALGPLGIEVPALPPAVLAAGVAP